MSDTEWQVEMRTCFLRLEIVVLLHCLNPFIPIKTVERDISVLSHLYIILINNEQKVLKSLSCLHMQTHTNVHRKQVAMNITYYFRLDLFSLFFLSFFWLPREWKKMIV